MGTIPASLDERVELLKTLNAPYYHNLGEDQLRLIAEPARLLEARPGEFLYHQGEPASYSYLVLSGLVKLLHAHPSGRAIIIKFIKPGLHFAWPIPT